MGKLPQVTQAELEKAAESADNLAGVLLEINERLFAARRNIPPNPAELACTFLGLSRAAADTAQHLISLAANAELARETEAKMRARVK